MDVFADLRAGADRDPGIDHRAFIDVGTDVDVGRHQHHATAEVAATAGDGRRDDAHAFLLEAGGVVVGEAAFDFVKVAGVAVFDGDVVVDAEGEQYRFFQPFVDVPATPGRFGDAHRAAFEGVQRFVDGGKQRGFGVGRGDVGAVLEGVFDGLLQGHDVFLVCRVGWRIIYVCAGLPRCRAGCMIGFILSGGGYVQIFSTQGV